jgi:HAMP domain-containing protein
MQHPNELDAEIQDRVVEMYLSAAKLDEITAETGVLRPTIYYILNKRGIRPQRTRRAAPSEVNTDQLLQRLDAQAREIGRLQAEVESLRAALAETNGAATATKQRPSAISGV